MKNVSKLFFMLVFACILLAYGCSSKATISVSAAKTTIGVDETTTVKAEVTPSGSEVLWSVDNASIATITDAGVVTGVKSGIVTVTGKLKSDESISATVKITVSELDKPLKDEYKGICRSGKTYLTTVGQADLPLVQNILGRTEYQLSPENNDYIYNNQLKASDVAAKQGTETTPVVLLVAASSGKGLGAAGTDASAELKRAQEFAEKAASGDIILIVIHVGGVSRRGGETDVLLNVVCPEANLMLVYNEGNSDNYFSNSSKNNNVDLYLYSAVTKMVDPMTTLFYK